MQAKLLFFMYYNQIINIHFFLLFFSLAFVSSSLRAVVVPEERNYKQIKKLINDDALRVFPYTFQEAKNTHLSHLPMGWYALLRLVVKYANFIENAVNKNENTIWTSFKARTRDYTQNFSLWNAVYNLRNVTSMQVLNTPEF